MFLSELFQNNFGNLRNIGGRLNRSTLQEFDLISFFEKVLETSAKIVLSLFAMFFEKFLFILRLRLND